MADIHFTLLTDGPSDRALIPILTWLLRLYFPESAIQPAWADLRRLPIKPRTLAGRIQWSIELYPCEILFIHRDAEREDRRSRVREIDEALEEITDRALPNTIRVIPVRMQEAWLLFDELAIRKAAGNPNGTESLSLPVFQRVEQLPDPKRVLYSLLEQASGLTGRRLKGFRHSFYASLIADYIDDFSPLRTLSAFRALESDVEEQSRNVP